MSRNFVGRTLAGEQARAAGDAVLEARALEAFGSALVHAARGRDAEGTASLHAALSIARDAGERGIAASAAREIAYVDALQGRYERALVWLAEAADLGGDAPAELAATEGRRGQWLADQGRYLTGLPYLERAVGLVAGTDSEYYWLAWLGRTFLMADRLDEARTALGRSVALSRQERWTSFLPQPESFLGDVDLAEGALDAANDRYEHAFALGCQLTDPCWEGLAARGLGLVTAARGDADGAIRRLLDARTRCVRLPDTYRWIEAYVLEALCQVAVLSRHPDARGWVGELEELAARGGMRDFVVRACLHRSELGDPEGLPAARLLVADVESSSLDRRIGEAAVAST